MPPVSPHPFATRWNHNSHYYPRIAAAVPPGAALVVDVGCGDGTLARYLARGGTPVLGIDPDADALPVDEGSDSTARFVQGVAEDLPLADASVDGLTMVMVLHHVDHARALAEVRRVLRPGGVAVVLGYGRVGSALDLPAEVGDLLAHRWHARGKTPWEPSVALADPDLTWRQSRRLLRTELPGGTYRRVPMWRYLYTWTAPL
ncbi:hypothetical protein CSO01_35370 [Cellulomonas soli]|uniref:Methyltransferase type 11 domain-containing protein n=1 Tax=Cellulomonas soli TaxID=931535 RepID=A0A512PI60_9CELL|nr:hypothetical protein CSO01_35370 [Cellulomonas soli]